MNLGSFASSFNSVGWFIPPYVQIGFLEKLRDSINAGRPYNLSHLESILSLAYTPISMAAMVSIRYPETPYIQDYKDTISEAVEAHCVGLNHVAVAGLVPVVEGAARKLCASRAIKVSGIKSLFSDLANDCKIEIIGNNIGNVQELLSMFESFVWYINDFLYVDSGAYLLADRTNRHGITHGAYSDSDYGRPLNFYKVLSTIDFLCLIAALRANISFLAPTPTPDSSRLAIYYLKCSQMRRDRPSE